jgi:clan AA aspartic protease
LVIGDLSPSGALQKSKNPGNEKGTIKILDYLRSPQDDGNLQEFMSEFKVNVVARNPKSEELSTQPVSALVDTGSELTWLPGDVLKSVGITPRRKRMFATATQQKIERDVGYAILSAEGYETNDEVLFAEPGDMTLLGVRTLEGFGVMVDNIAHRFVATTTLVARIQKTNSSK